MKFFLHVIYKNLKLYQIEDLRFQKNIYFRQTQLQNLFLRIFLNHNSYKLYMIYKPVIPESKSKISRTFPILQKLVYNNLNFYLIS